MAKKLIVAKKKLGDNKAKPEPISNVIDPLSKQGKSRALMTKKDAQQLGLSPSVLSQLNHVRKLVDGYITQVKNEDPDATKTLTQVVNEGEKLSMTQQAYKMGLGVVFYGLRNTLDKDSYAKTIEDKYHMTTTTADRYATVFEAWASGMYDYELPPGESLGRILLMWSIRDLETGAKLIQQGLLTEENFDTLTSEGDWKTKRNIINGKDIVDKDDIVPTDEDYEGFDLSSADEEKDGIVYETILTRKGDVEIHYDEPGGEKIILELGNIKPTSKFKKPIEKSLVKSFYARFRNRMEGEE